MASVEFEKLHDAGAVKARIRHNDREERLIHEHKNEQIDKTKTPENLSFTKLDYKQKCRKYDERIRQIDSTTNSNKRKDRVTAFALSIPIPEFMNDFYADRWCNDVGKLLVKKYGAQNVISLDEHKDEIHSYIDAFTKEEKTSRIHLQAVIIPEIDGRLDGKQFSSKAAMKQLNKEIDDLTREKYEMRFLTHQKHEGGFRTVENLKDLSDEELNKREEQLDEMKQEEAALLPRIEQEREEIRQIEQEELPAKRDELAEVESSLQSAADQLQTVRAEKEHALEQSEVMLVSFPKPKEKGRFADKNTVEFDAKEWEDFQYNISDLQDIADTGSQVIEERDALKSRTEELETTNKELNDALNTAADEYEELADKYELKRKENSHLRKALTSVRDSLEKNFSQNMPPIISKALDFIDRALNFTFNQKEQEPEQVQDMVREVQDEEER